MGVKPAGMWRVSADISWGRGAGAGVHIGLPLRLCGRHKMTVYRIPAADVMW